MGGTESRPQGEHVRRIASGRECNRAGESGNIVIRSPEARGGAKRREGWEEALSQAAPSEVRAGRRLSLRWRRASQWRTACSKVSAAARHLGQVEGVSQLYQDGCAAR